MPIAVEATPGQARDVTAYDDLMEQRDSDAGALLADKGYDSDAIRDDLRDRGASPEIPTKSNRVVKYSVAKPLYALRAPGRALHRTLKGAAPDRHAIRQNHEQLCGLCLTGLSATLGQVCPQGLVHRFHEGHPQRGIPSVTGRLVGNLGVNVVAGHHGSTSAGGGAFHRSG
jgi:hypothetical protein